MKHNHPTQQGGNAAGMPQKRKMNKAVLSRTIRMLHGYYPVLVPVSVACIVLSAIVAVLPAIFLQQVTDVIDHCLTNGTPWDTARGMIIPKVMLLIGFYVLSIIAVTVETQLSAVVTQAFSAKCVRPCSTGCRISPSVTSIRTSTAILCPITRTTSTRCVS